MKEMELKYINNTYRYLLPLYDYDYVINNDVIEFQGVYSRCSYYPSNSETGIFVKYIVKDVNKVDDILFPNVCNKHIENINSEIVMILELNIPVSTRDWCNLLNCKFVNVSWNCKNKILHSPTNKQFKDILVGPLCNHYNYNLRQTSKTTLTSFNKNDLLNW